MRKEVIGNATLYLGDCLEILPTLPKVDAVITDPPYGVSAQHSNGKMGGTSHNLRRWRNQLNKEYPKFAGDDKPIDPAPLLALCDDCTIWGGNYIADNLPPSSCWLIWYKRINGQSNNFADCEMAWTSRDGPARVFQHLWMGMLRDSEMQEHWHATQKPAALMRWCVAMTTGTVLDAYMGSGSTGVACMSLQRPFIGIEIEPKYFDIACERIENAQRQERLFA